jgi:hypothetical protein
MVTASGARARPDELPTADAVVRTAVEVVFIPVPGICWLASLTRQAASWRRSSGERRQQLKWLLGGSATCLTGLVLAVWLGNRSGFWGLVSLVGFLAITALPVSMGVAILKYRLYDIDRIISRTLAYAIITGLLLGVYAGLVLLTTQVFRVHTPVAVAASTLAAAALFNPLRRRVQRVVDRRFNRARYDADKMVAAFAARLKDACPGWRTTARGRARRALTCAAWPGFCGYPEIMGQSPPELPADTLVSAVGNVGRGVVTHITIKGERVAAIVSQSTLAMSHLLAVLLTSEMAASALPAALPAAFPWARSIPDNELEAFAGELREAVVAESPEAVERVLIDWQAVAEVRAGARST